MDNYMSMMGMTPEMMRASAKPAALKQVQVELALTAVAKAEGITASDEEYEEEAAKLAEQYNMPLEQVKAIVSVDSLKKDITLRKANDLVIASAKVGEKAEKAEGEEKPKRSRAKKKAEEPKAE